MRIKEFNNLDKDAAAKELFSCCGSPKWVRSLMKEFPFESGAALIEKATREWYDECDKKDWLEAFAHHPKIGDKKSLAEKFAGKEQAGVATATAELIDRLAKANNDYEKKYGFIFIVCATGKSAEEMLQLLNDRLRNKAEEELDIAMGEQHKITLIRFKKLFEDLQLNIMSQLTTHVLDIAAGKPAKNISIRLMHKANDSWDTIAQGVTNADGRIADLLPAGKKLVAGNYKMVFETGHYYAANKISTFYPVVEVIFTVADESHYHVPLLISPYGYSTYRGS